MAKRTITVSIEEGFVTKIRDLQSDEMKKRNETFNFSQALEIVLSRGFKE